MANNTDGLAPICDIDFFSVTALADPVDCYHKMLSLGPVVWLPKNKIHAICGYDAVTSTLRDHRVFRSGKGVSINEDINSFLVGNTLNSDPPQHDEQRAITFGPLTPRALGDVRAKVEEHSNIIADKVAKMGAFDAVSDLATYLPLTIVRDLVGLGEGGKEHMLNWAGATFEMMGDPRERRENAMGKMRGLRAFLEDPNVLEGLSSDGWASRATKLSTEAGFDPKRAVSLMRDYIAPSLDTTISAIGYAILLFAQNPAQWDKLRQDRSLVKNAIEEVVRLNTPIKAFSRFVEEETDVASVPISKGDRVLVVYGAANRDKSKFENPDHFDIERNTRGHVGFGHGVHACLGMHLARLEMNCLFNALADRIESFELAADPVMAKNSTIHALSELRVQVCV